MRIWSLHPHYLDSKGLVAAWREGLLAKAVLEDKTKGYKNHPQLDRFKAADMPLEAINIYLGCLHQEAVFRGYNFDGSKLNPVSVEYTYTNPMQVTKEQVAYEAMLLAVKIWNRKDRRTQEDIDRIMDLVNDKIEYLWLGDNFELVGGQIEPWEKTYDSLFNDYDKMLEEIANEFRA